MFLMKLPFRKKNSDFQENDNVIHNIPKHIGIIMDGNGRWAKKKGLPRVAGHKEGMDNVKRIVRVANSYRVEILTLYAFSTENWKRPSAEVEYLMRLPTDFFHNYLPELIEENVQVRTIGNIEKLPKHTQKSIQSAKDATKNNNGLILNIAINYGGRNEIIEAVKTISEDVLQQKISVEDINESLFGDYLSTSSLVDPDLLIRTSGELRLSNYLLWQSAYSELWFTDTLWPDFSAEEFKEALLDYQQRKRRFGGI
ncbi:undecaprenyl diphosphate synthase [Gracilibacillus halotolerans]|uniref:Isoprenyl transferase n=1 Tax=Gracilibacillus halotolerans TaxID=74386 RepID=A0A841RC22_9BACI|nr:undecaprenyl diphosphate synthase [Gracilibacillus halotolerans]